MNKAITKYLDIESMRLIMSEIYKIYNTKLEEDLYKKIDIFSSAAKNR